MKSPLLWLACLVFAITGDVKSQNWEGLTKEDEDLLNQWKAMTGAIVTDEARVVQILRAMEKHDNTKDLNQKEIEDQAYLESLIPMENDDEIGDMDENDEQFINKDQFIKEFDDAMEAGYVIPKSYDSYALGLVTKAKYQKTGICYSFAATAVMETCYLKAVTEGLTPPNPTPSTENNIKREKFQKGLDLAETFPVRCKNMKLDKEQEDGKGWLDSKLAPPYNTLGFVKRLAGMPPNEAEWQYAENSFEKSCEEAMNNMDRWTSKEAHVVKYGAVNCESHEKIKYMVSKYGAVAITSRKGAHYEVIYGYGEDERGEYYLLKNSWGSHWRKEEDGKIKGSTGFPKVYLNSEQARNIGGGVMARGYCTFAQCAKGDMMENKHDFCRMGEGVETIDGFQEIVGSKVVTFDCQAYYEKEHEPKMKNAKKYCKSLEKAAKTNPEKRAEWEKFPLDVTKSPIIKVWCKDRVCRCIDLIPGSRAKSCCGIFKENGLAIEES